MVKKMVIGETTDILQILPAEQLQMFASIRQNAKMWESFKSFVQAQKQIKMDQIYRLRRPKTVDDTVKNAVEHDYYCGRISSYVILLQIMENAGEELERRERKGRR